MTHWVSVLKLHLGCFLRTQKKKTTPRKVWVRASQSFFVGAVDISSYFVVFQIRGFEKIHLFLLKSVFIYFCVKYRWIGIVFHNIFCEPDMKSTWINVGRFPQSSTTISSEVGSDRDEIQLFAFGEFKSFIVNWWSAASVDIGMVISCLLRPKSENRHI